MCKMIKLTFNSNKERIKKYRELKKRKKERLSNHVEILGETLHYTIQALDKSGDKMILVYISEITQLKVKYVLPESIKGIISLEANIIYKIG